MLNNYIQKVVLGLAATAKVGYKREICLRNFLKRRSIPIGFLYLLVKFLKVKLKLKQIYQLWTEWEKKKKCFPELLITCKSISLIAFKLESA